MPTIAATMLAHGERRLLTLNAKDFRRLRRADRAGEAGDASMSIKTGVPEGALAAKQRVSDGRKRCASDPAPMLPSTCATTQAWRR